MTKAKKIRNLSAIEWLETRKGSSTYSIGHDDRADHAGTKVALLAGGNVVLRHFW